MLPDWRERFNAEFTAEKYALLQQRLEERTRAQISFRIAETPCFISSQLMDEMIQAGEQLTLQLTENEEYMRASAAAIPDRYRMPNENRRPLFMTVDFGLVKEEDGSLSPRLVELQAFPSVFGYQAVLAEEYASVYGIEGCEWFLGGLNDSSYWALLREQIVGAHDREEVILAEVTPHQQKTLPDFNVHTDRLGIQIVDIASLKKRGSSLFYETEGREVKVKRIYNRAIVEEIERKGIELPFDYRDELDVEWAGHPNWYFRASKFALPYLAHKTVPGAVFLDEWMAGKGRDRLTDDRQQWVLKPLYSFAGKGVEFAPSEARLLEIPEPERANYLLQHRVPFEPTIATPAGLTQAEIRILYLWPEGKRMQPMISLVRMGRGLMMGVDHNWNLDWVGGSAAFVPNEVASLK